MIDISEALNWLNAIDNRSYLNNEACRLIQAVAGFGPDDSRARLILERLRNMAHSPGDPRQKAEILLYCAGIGYWRGWYPQAANDAREAMLSYDDDDHRRAVALWMLGSTQWKMRQNHDAYRNWDNAREIFKQCEPLFQHFPKEKSWYRNHIRSMDVKSAMRPEENWTWLNCFEPSNLRTPTQQVVDCVQEKVRERAYSNVYVLMQDLQEANQRSTASYEKAEIYLEFGLAMYQMGNTYYAIELLRKSVLYFYPGVETYHKQVVARCMLGALEWMQRSSHNQADADWTCCIDELEKLRGWADRDNCQEKEKWYAQHRDILRVALFEKHKQNPKPQYPESGTSDETIPKPSPSTPSNQSPDLYNELLMKVGWDRARAERLIDVERKNAPSADRDELIKRAIEHWNRDNQ